MRRSRSLHRAGFTLAEALVSLAIITILVVVVLALFDFNSKLARVQTNLADMQQSLRIGQYEVVRALRYAGRGSLPTAQGSFLGVATPNPFLAKHFAGVAVDVLDNVAANTNIATGDASTPLVVPGTDVLTIRGNFSTPVYQVDYTNPTTYSLTGSPPTGGTVIVSAVTPTGLDQALTTWQQAIDSGRPEAIVLASAQDLSVYAVAELVPGSSSIDTGVTPNVARLTFRFTGSSNADAYSTLSMGGAFDTTRFASGGTRGAVAMISLVEEYRYYIRDDRTNPALPVPRLARARFYPGTNLPWNADAAELRSDIADNIMDLQVAIGLDVTGDNRVTEDRVTPATDEWLFNSPADDATTAPWPSAGGTMPKLLLLRVNTFGRTDRRDPQYQAPQIVAIEDNSYALNPTDEGEVNGRQSLMFRRRLLQTFVNMRNIS